MLYARTHKKEERLLQEGFSLIEIVVALAIMAFIAAIVAPGVLKYLERGKVAKAQGTVQSLKLAITQFNIDAGSFPQTLKDLERRPTDERLKKNWKGPYVDSEIPDNDPWGEPYVYRVTPGARYPYELYSLGSNGIEGNKEERIGQWNP